MAQLKDDDYGNCQGEAFEELRLVVHAGPSSRSVRKIGDAGHGASAAMRGDLPGRIRQRCWKNVWAKIRFVRAGKDRDRRLLLHDPGDRAVDNALLEF